MSDRPLIERLKQIEQEHIRQAACLERYPRDYARFVADTVQEAIDEINKLNKEVEVHYSREQHWRQKADDRLASLLHADMKLKSLQRNSSTDL